MSDQPRILVATPIAESKLYLWDELVESLRRQDIGERHGVAFDWLIIDNTDEPDEQYLTWLRRFAASRPLGPNHGIRLRRFGKSVDGLRFSAHIFKVGYSERLIFGWLTEGEEQDESVAVEDPRPWEYAARWQSYSHLLSLECDVLVPPDGFSKLYEAGLPWASAWMLSRTIRDPRYPGVEKKLPLIWDKLDLEHYRHIKEDATAAGVDQFEWLQSLGWLEPPSTEPFPCVVAHLGCTLIDRPTFESVPFRMTSVGGDVQYSWDCLEAGVQPMCVPAVSCDHVAVFERPDYRPAYLTVATEEAS